MLFKSILSTLLRVVLPSVTMLLLKYSLKILFTPLPVVKLFWCVALEPMNDRLKVHVWAKSLGTVKAGVVL